VARLPNHFNKVIRLENMFERMTAGYTVGIKISMRLIIELRNKANVWVGLTATRHPSGINSNSLIIAQRANQTDKVALATADFDHRLITQRIFINKALRGSSDESHKRWRETLLILIALSEVVPLSVELAIENKATVIAEG